MCYSATRRRLGSERKTHQRQIFTAPSSAPTTKSLDCGNTAIEESPTVSSAPVARPRRRNGVMCVCFDDVHDPRPPPPPPPPPRASRENTATLAPPTVNASFSRSATPPTASLCPTNYASNAARYPPPVVIELVSFRTSHTAIVLSSEAVTSRCPCPPPPSPPPPIPPLASDVTALSCAGNPAMSLPPFASRKLTCPSPVPATIHDCICATDRIPPPVDVAVASEEEEEEARGAHRHDAPSVPTSASANRRRPSAVPITIEDDDDVAERHVKPTTRAVDNGGLSLVVSKETRRESAPSRFADGDASSNDGDRENRSPTAPAPALGDDGDEFDADLNPRRAAMAASTSPSPPPH